MDLGLTDFLQQVGGRGGQEVDGSAALFVVGVCVEGGGQWGFVAHKVLDFAQADSPGVEAGAEGVTKGMWSDVFEFGSSSVFGDHHLDGARRDAFAATAGDKDGVGVGHAKVVSTVEPIEKGNFGGAVEGDDALFVAFADDAHLVALKVDMGAVEVGEFGDTQAGVEKGLEDGAIANGEPIVALDLGEEVGDLRLGEVFGDAALDGGEVEVGGGVGGDEVGAGGVGEEGFEAGDFATEGGVGELVLVFEVYEVGGEVGVGDVGQALDGAVIGLQDGDVVGAGADEVAVEGLEVAAVFGQGGGGAAALGLEVVEPVGQGGLEVGHRSPLFGPG